MPKTQEQNDELKLKRKENIILAALKVFCEKGYEGATVDDITKKAECSHGLFYHYFGSKKQIFDAVIESAGKSSNKQVEAILCENAPCAKRLENVINFLFNSLKEDESRAYYFYFFFSKHFIDVLNGIKPNRPRCPDKKPTFMLIEELFEEGVKNGEFSNAYSAKEYAKLMHSIVQGVTMAYTVMPTELKKTFSPPNVGLIVDIFKNN